MAPWKHYCQVRWPNSPSLEEYLGVSRLLVVKAASEARDRFAMCQEGVEVVTARVLRPLSGKPVCSSRCSGFSVYRHGIRSLI